MSDHKMNIEERLNRHPILKSRIESLPDIAENTSGITEKADDAEMRVIEELRRMGNEMMHEWASANESSEAEGFRTYNEDAVGHGKKKFTGIRHSGK